MQQKSKVDTPGKLAGRGGPGRGQGKKPLSTQGSVVLQVRVSPDQHKKIMELGGAKVVRKMIDDAPAKSS